MSDKTVLLKVESCIFEANANLLIDNSLYFRAMFNGAYIESNQQLIELKNITSKPFRLILQKLNDNTTDFNDDAILDILRTSYLLQIDSISTTCIDRLMTLVTDKKYCLQIWKLSNDLFIPKLSKVAKYMSLIEFQELSTSPYLNSFDFNLLFEYLSCTALHVATEFTVFQVILNWWYANRELLLKVNTIEKYSILFILLTCIDFDCVETVEIERMIHLLDDKENQDVVQVLECLISNRNDCHYANYSKNVGEKVKILLQSGHRLVPEVPCAVSLTYDDCVMNTSIYFYDEDTKMMKVLGRFSMLDNLEGYTLIAYKNWIYVFGGQNTSGRIKVWNNSSFWKINIVTDHIVQLKRHDLNVKDAKAVIVDATIFLISSNEVNDVIIFRYDIIKDDWSKIETYVRNIERPQFCYFQNKLFVLPNRLSKRVGYIFSEDFRSYTPIDIESKLSGLIDKNSIIEYLLSDNGNLYMKTNNSILVAKCDNCTLTISDMFPVPQKSTTNNAICGTRDRKLYSFHKHQFFMFTEELYLFLIDIDKKSMQEVDILKGNMSSKHVEWYLGVGSFAIFHPDSISKLKSISSLTF